VPLVKVGLVGHRQKRLPLMAQKKLPSKREQATSNDHRIASSPMAAKK
jgi:hypothetical protein